MYFDASLTVIEIRKNQNRPGFLDKYHQVIFSLDSKGIDSMEMKIWVHSNYPETEIVKVARTFLHRRLLDFVEILDGEIYTPEEIDALWQSIKPATIK